MKKKISNRSLRLESLEDRMLLAVTAGGEEAIAAQFAPAETGAEVVVTDISFNGLRKAINSAAAGDTIVFDGSGTITITSAIMINKNITIDGGGDIVFKGAGENFLFNFGASATNVVFENLDLTGGYSTTNGMGGIAPIDAGRGLTLNNCNIYGNTANDTDAGFMGGAFYVTGTLNMNNCSVYANKAVYGGFAYINGRKTSATLTATNCNFYGNTADTGAVIWNMAGTLNLTNCSVVGNTGAGAVYNNNFFVVGSRAGGGYSHEYYICDTTINNSIIAYNNGPDGSTADVWDDYVKQLSGGGVLQWEMFNIDDTFTKSECATSIIGMEGDYFVSAPVFDAEGTLDLDAVDLTIKTDSVAAWAGVGANPGAYTGAGVDGYLVVTTLDDVADGSDGVVSLREALEYATLGTFDAAPTITFASELSGGTITLTSGQLTAITSVNIIADNVTVDADGDSRVLFVKSFNYQMNMDGTFYDFDSVPVCPAHVYDPAYQINVTIDGVNFTGGADTAVSRTSGGAGILAFQNVNLTLANSTVSNSVLNVTTDYAVEGATYTNIGGGGIAAIYYANIALDNVSVLDNAVRQTGDRGTNIILAGGGIFVSKRAAMIAKDITVSGNALTSQEYENSGHTQWGYGYGYGGGISVFGIADIDSSEISDNEIVGCAIMQRGGGVFHYISDYNRYAAGTDYSLVLTSTSVTGNSIGDHHVENNGWCQGGGIFSSGKALLVNDLVANNAIDSQDNSIGMTAYIQGAGIYNGAISDYNSQNNNNVNKTQMDIYYSTITNNKTWGIDVTNWYDWGGGIYNANSFADADRDRPVTGTVNLVGSILYHNYSAKTDTTETANVDTFNESGAAFNMSNVLYNKSGIKGSGINYGDNCIAWLAMYKVFNDEVAGDYTLWTGTRPSQALNALSADAATPPAQYIPAYDLHGEPWVRVYGEAQDFGCYEYQPTPTPTFQITITDYAGDYDGAAHSVSLSGLEAGDVVTYSADGETYSSDVISYTDPGTYTVYVKVQREGYQDFAGTGTVTINSVTEKINVAVVVSASAASATELDVLPDSITSATVGDTLYAQVWILNADNSALGCTGGYIDLSYTAAALDAGSYTVSPIYAQMATYVDSSADGLVATFGGCSQTGVNDLAVNQWALLGTFTFTASAAGDVEIASALPTMNGSHITGLNLARAGEGNFADSEIAFSSASFTVTSGGGGEQLAAPTISTGKGVYVSYGANRHYLQWSAVDHASGYELSYSANGGAWTTINAAEPNAVVRGLTYGDDVTYRVRALGDGVSYTDSDWSASKTFNVCPMDINNDEDISGGDRTLLANSWLAEEGDDNYQYYADINGDGDIGGADRAYLSNNWLGEVGDDDLQYPPAKRADAFFADFASADLDVDLGAF